MKSITSDPADSLSDFVHDYDVYSEEETDDNISVINKIANIGALAKMSYGLHMQAEAGDEIKCIVKIY